MALTPKQQAAWDANVAAIQDAKSVVAAAISARAAVEVECGTAARRRDPIHPVLNEAEVAQVIAARDAVVAARAAVTAAQATFKAGVN
jgi:hypothetical protein